MEYSQDILQAALEGLELKRSRLIEQIESVKALMGGKKRGRPAKSESAETETAAAPAKKGRKRGKRNLSPEARERIAAAQKKRWAEYHAAQ